jgi:hypothetical protein
MDHVSSNYTGSVPILNSDRPSSSSSIVDRIRQITQGVLAKMDELYDKFGGSIHFIGLAGLTIAVALPKAYFIAACILGISSILVWSADWHLGHRHIKYLYNKIINTNKDLQLQLKNIQEEMKNAKLMEQISQSQSREELVENSKNVAALLKEFQKTTSDIYESYKSTEFVYFKMPFEIAFRYLETSERYDKETICKEINRIYESFQEMDKKIAANIAYYEKELKEKT